MNNKKVGNDFEQEFCNMLSMRGFWAHNMANRKNGQPADIIAAKDGKAYLIDCKVCSNKKFEFKRVEENQVYAMERWDSCGNGSGWFALKFDDKIYMLSYSHLKILKYRDIKGLQLKEIDLTVYTFEEWLGAIKNENNN